MTSESERDTAIDALLNRAAKARGAMQIAGIVYQTACDVYNQEIAIVEAELRKIRESATVSAPPAPAVCAPLPLATP